MKRRKLKIYISESNIRLNRILNISRQIIQLRKDKRALRKRWEELLSEFTAIRDNNAVNIN